MAHDRFRQIQPLYSKVSAASPIVGIFGHRQVGKTTLATQLCRKYITFDDPEIRVQAESNPTQFIRSHYLSDGTTVLDECQLVPELFPVLKEWVRTHKRPGQFLLTGSVRFSSRRAIRESLTGRMIGIELLPLVISELQQTSLPDLMIDWSKRTHFDKQVITEVPPPQEQKKTQKTWESYLESGGMPGLCFLRNARLRQESLKSLHQLILDRDLRLIVETKLSLQTLTAFLEYVATLGFDPYVAAEATRKLRIAIPTQKSLLFALESIFLIRRIPLEGKKGFMLLMEDQFEENQLKQIQGSESSRVLGGFYRNVRAQLNYRLGGRYHWSSYWLNTGARVPLVLHYDGHQLGFFSLEADTPTISQWRSANRFLRDYPKGKVIFLSSLSNVIEWLDDRTLICSISALVG